MNRTLINWIVNGETGMSSKTMWACFVGEPQGYPSYPHDPDDFSRCYKLLEWAPECKSRLGELSILSKQWKNLIENWAKLTEMYELNVSEKWENSKKIGMYEFMKELTK